MERPSNPAPGSDYSDAVRQVMERAAQADAAQAPVRLRRPVLTRPPVVAALAAVTVAVGAWNVSQWRTEPVPLPPQHVEAALDVSVLAATQAVEQYREEHGRLPTSLQELDFPPGLRLEVSGEGYRIVGEDGPFSAEIGNGEGVEAFVERLGQPGGEH